MTAPRVAAVPGYAASWIVAQLHAQGVNGAAVRADAARARRYGHTQAADALEAGWAQLVAAADEHRARANPRPVAAAFAQESAPAKAATREASSPGGETLTTREAGELLGLTPQRVGQLIAAGELDGRRAGRTWQLHRAQVENLAAGRREQ